MNLTRCDQCGQTDDHPKVHVSDGGTFHHDCLAADFRAALIGSSREVESIIKAAESGTRGAALREHIANVHKEG